MLEKTEGGNQEWTIQRHRQHWAHKTQDKDRKKKGDPKLMLAKGKQFLLLMRPAMLLI
jgi:hypothetical protein